MTSIPSQPDPRESRPRRLPRRRTAWFTATTAALAVLAGTAVDHRASAAPGDASLSWGSRIAAQRVVESGRS